MSAVATEWVTRLGACVFDLKFSSVSNNMHLVLSLTKVPIVSLCTKGPPWVAPRKPPFGGLVLGGVITWRPCGRYGEPSPFRTPPEGRTGLRTVRLHLRMHGGFLCLGLFMVSLKGVNHLEPSRVTRRHRYHRACS